MSPLLSTLLTCWLSLLPPDDDIIIRSTHRLVYRNLWLDFELMSPERETSMARLSKFCDHLSPNEYCDILLYDKHMKTITYPLFILWSSSTSIEDSHVTLGPGKPITFTCEVDTSKLRYSFGLNGQQYRNCGRESTTPRYRDIYYYKLFYHGPASHPKGAVCQLESELFSLK